MWRPDVARELAEPVSDLVADELGWVADRRDAERERFESELMAWTLDGASETGSGSP